MDMAADPTKRATGQRRGGKWPFRSLSSTHAHAPPELGPNIPESPSPPASIPIPPLALSPQSPVGLVDNPPPYWLFPSVG